MSAPENMMSLSARKRLLIAQADLHRQFIGLECRHVGQRMEGAQDFIQQKRWLLWGGAAIGGLVLASRWRGVLSLLPDVWRIWRR